MLREIDLKEISDGRLYTSNDMVRADCGGCKGCSDCCRGMGSSVILDPLDVFRLCEGLGMTFGELLDSYAELGVVDGVILPHLRMTGRDEACVFLDADGRCSVHPHRPGFCRLFPLGRFYENGSFRYFLQVHECPKTDRAKIKIRRWIDTPDIRRYERYICDWHYYLRGLQDIIMPQDASPDDIEANIKNVGMRVLKTFYMEPYRPDTDFYEQFYERLEHELARTNMI